jgi:glycosyltransferase involved in cell wall biosynthesis
VQAVRSDAFAGVERYVTTAANELNRRGHRVHVIGGDPNRMPLELSEEVGYSPGSSTREVFAALLGRKQVALVHAHMTAAELAAVASSLHHRAPIVSTRHFPDRRARRAIARPAAVVIRLALAQQITISRFVAEGIFEPSLLLYNGVPSRAQAQLVAPRVLMLQRLEEEKCPDVGLRAWAKSELGQKGWQLVVAGSGSRAAAARRESAKLGASDSVLFLGSVSDTDALLCDASVLIAPAAAEPFGLAVVEAMAHGVPVVAAAGGAHRETLGTDGLFFAPGDVETAASHLRRLGEHVAWRREVGTRLRARQQRLFSLDSHIARLEQVYASVSEVAIY